MSAVPSTSRSSRGGPYRLLAVLAGVVAVIGVGLLAISGSRGQAKAVSAPATPVEAVNAYFAQINRQAYGENWPLLTEHFRKRFTCCHSAQDDLSAYAIMWDQVAGIDVGSVETVEETDGRATVRADLTYQMTDGPSVRSPATEIRLLWDPSNRRWLFEDQIPLGPGDS